MHGAAARMMLPAMYWSASAGEIQGLNTYRVELKKFNQPTWVTDTRIDPKEVLRNLTAVSISAYCDECRPSKGMLVVDNVVFEK